MSGATSPQCVDIAPLGDLQTCVLWFHLVLPYQNNLWCPHHPPETMNQTLEMGNTMGGLRGLADFRSDLSDAHRL